MEELAHKLAINGVNHQMKFDNVGLGKEGNLKYFIGLNFQIDKKNNKADLEKKYFSKIEEMFGEGGRFARSFSTTLKNKR